MNCCLIKNYLNKIEHILLKLSINLKNHLRNSLAMKQYYTYFCSSL